MSSQLHKLRSLFSTTKLSPFAVRRRHSSSSNFNIMEASKSIKDLGYAFNTAGQLRKIGEDGMPGDELFQFNISSQHQECQAHYEELGAAVTDYVYQLLETQEELIQLPVPKDAKPGKGTFVFASKDYDKKNTLMILIHGSGAVRAGQWARSLIINDNLDSGTQIPYIKQAKSRNYSVILFNTNDNYELDGKKIPKSGTGEEHAHYVWDTYISKTKATNIVIVAHSYGGVITVALSDQIKKDFEKRVKAIALTDSVHGYSNIKISSYLKKISRNWVSSSEPLDKPLNTPDFEITRVSAGHPKHEMTSCTSIHSIFKFIEEKLSEE